MIFTRKMLTIHAIHKTTQQTFDDYIYIRGNREKALQGSINK